jgi:hypothetical protein
MSVKNLLYSAVAAVGTFIAFPYVAVTGLAAFGYTSTGNNIKALIVFSVLIVSQVLQPVHVLQLRKQASEMLLLVVGSHILRLAG